MKLKKSVIKVKKQKKMQADKLIYETNDYTYSFRNFQTIKTFGRDIYEGKITIEEADQYQTNLLVEIMNFRKNMKPRSQQKKKRKKKNKLFLKTCINFERVEKKFLTLLKANYFR